MTITQLLTAAGIIKSETSKNANTHIRVGTMLENIIAYIRDNISGGKQKHFYQSTRPTPDLVDAGDEWTSTITFIKFTWNGYEFVNLND